MEYFMQLKSNGWIPEYSKEMYAIYQLRKLVYYLSTAINIETLSIILFKLNLGHVDLKGNTQKEKVIFMLNYCRENNLLQDFYNVVDSLKILPKDNIDTKVLSYVPDERIKYLYFDIPDFASCQWYHRTIDGEKETLNLHKNNNNVTMHYNKHNPCEKVYTCNICGTILNRTTEHDWSKWEYVSANSCNNKRSCKRCGTEEISYGNHDWSRYHNTPNGSTYRICQHCFLKEYNIKGKWRGYVNWDKGTIDLWEITFYKETFLLVFNSSRAIIDVYVNVDTEKNICERKVKEKAKVKVSGQKITIIGKKIITGGNYILDNLNGIISDNCLYIEGEVYSKNYKGKIKLEQIHEKD